MSALPPAGTEGDSGAAPARSSRTFGRRAGLIFFGRFIMGTGQLVTAAVLAHILDKESFGTLTLLLLLYATVSGIMAMAAPENVLFFLPRLDPGGRRATAWQVARILAVLGMCAGGVLMLLGLFPEAVFGDAPRAARYVPLLAAYALFDVPALMLPNVLIAEDLHRWASWTSIFQTIAQLSAILVPCALGFPLWVALVALLAYGVVHVTALMLVLHGLYRRHAPRRGMVKLREHLGFALPLGLSSIVGNVIKQFDKFLVLFVLGLASFAEYTVGAWEIPLVTLLPYSIGAAMVPVMVRSFEAGKPGEALSLWKSTIQKTAMVVLPVAFVFLICAEDFVVLAFGQAYVKAAWPLRLYTLILFQRVVEYGAILRAAGDTRAILYSSLILFVGNAVISIPLVYVIGFNGPALGALLASVPCWIYLIVRIARVSRTSWRDVFPWLAYGRVFGAATLSAVPVSAFRCFVDLSPGPGLAVAAAGYLATFALVGTVMGVIRREDWSFAGQWVSMKGLVR